VTLGDAAYPQSLLAIEDPPLMLYLLGPADQPRSEPNRVSAPLKR
jgi:predicted Rossmann fold nucleotide-binding protein DprA/Smf involved in DNA uptake